MSHWLRQLALCFSAGAVGGLAKGGAVWCGAQIALTAAFAAHLAAAQFPAGFYARIVWGGIAAFLLLLPLMRGSWLWRGLCCALIVAAIQAIAIPLLAHGSIKLAAIPLLSTLVLSVVWGTVSAAILRLIE